MPKRKQASLHPRMQSNRVKRGKILSSFISKVLQDPSVVSELSVTAMHSMGHSINIKSSPFPVCQIFSARQADPQRVPSHPSQPCLDSCFRKDSPAKLQDRQLTTWQNMKTTLLLPNEDS